VPDSQCLPDAPTIAATSGPCRFDRVAITSVFGPASDPRTWSGAPYNLAAALLRRGVIVESIDSSISRIRRLHFGLRHLARGFGRLSSSEQVLRGAEARALMSLTVAAETARLGVRHVLHTGTLDLPAFDLLPGIRHYLYCDQTWDLSLRFRPDIGAYTAQAIADFERLEADALRGLAHVFTFARSVRENLISHYGLAPDRVTAVGSGMGRIEPYAGVKTYGPPRLLFVAKHLFAAKGGRLVIDAFARARARRPDLQLTIVADAASRRFVRGQRSIRFLSGLPWPALQALYRDASLLVQPMINDPWGQVYLEALASRTPVLGLDRNGLPEIAGDGRYGFLLARPDAAAIADAIVDAVACPARLERMGWDGQAHVRASFGWDRAAARIALLSDERNEIHVG
jgi:glycosyltransferase involved in cell wall biosynthesis